MIRNRIYWVTDEKEMALINPDLSFVAVVDHESKWTEEVKISKKQSNYYGI